MNTFHRTLHDDLFKECLRFYNSAPLNGDQRKSGSISNRPTEESNEFLASDEEQPYDTFEEIRFAESKDIKNAYLTKIHFIQHLGMEMKKERYAHNCALNLLSSQGAKCKVLREKGELRKSILVYFKEDPRVLHSRF